DSGFKQQLQFHTVLHYLARQTMPCLFPLLYQKAVLKGRGFKPNFLVMSFSSSQILPLHSPHSSRPV
ncbi:MAG TPA: hypothetical protein VK184_26910, partial [Nostocaceae cyanobacterium]|nr:hypothetical protein [Nostocaceae cyanobacterium]